jgi:hypothetical protein
MGASPLTALNLPSAPERYMTNSENGIQTSTAQGDRHDHAPCPHVGMTVQRPRRRTRQRYEDD